MANDYLGREIDTVAIRESFKDAVGRDLNMSDKVLVNFIVSAGKRWTDLEDQDDPEKAACDLLQAYEIEVSKISISDTGISALVNKMDDDFHTAIREDVEATIKGKTTAVHMLAHFRRLYTLDELNGMPIPGTEPEHVTGNQRPDKTKSKDQTGKPITVVWTNDFVSAMPEGREYEQDIDDVAKETKAPGSVVRFKGKFKSDLETIKADATARRNALRSIVKRTIALHHQWVAVSEMEKVGLRWIKAQNKERSISMPNQYGEGEFNADTFLVSASVKPIWLYSSDDPSAGRNFSVTQFLAFDVAMAIKAGGTLADLVATAGRGSDDQGEGEGDGVDLPDDAAQAVASQFYNWFNVREHQALVLKKIANRKADADGNDWLDLIGSIYLAVKPIYEKNKAAYEELQTKDAA